MSDDGGMQWWAEIGQYQAMLASDPAYQAWLDEQDQQLRKERNAKHQSDDRIQVPETI